MARTSQPLEDRPPSRRDWSVSDEIWDIPKLVARRGRALGIDQQELARRAGVSQGTISKLLSYKTLKRFPMATAFALEDALSAPGLLTQRPPRDGSIDERGFERDAQKLSEPPGPKLAKRASK